RALTYPPLFRSLVIPVSVMGFWLVRGIRAGETFQLLVGPAWRSVLASGLAAGAALLGALPVGLLVVRHGGRFSRLVERTSFVGYALPGIVVALALVDRRSTRLDSSPG